MDKHNYRKNQNHTQIMYTYQSIFVMVSPEYTNAMYNITPITKTSIRNRKYDLRWS